MKEIVKKIKKSQVELSEITNDSFVGILWSNEKRAKILTIDESSYIGFCIGDMDLRTHWRRSSKVDYVKSAMEQDGVVAFLFDSLTELNEWLLEK